MKGNKKFLAIALLLLFVAVSFGTYAIYKSTAEASDTINAANWVVEVNGDDITMSTSNTFTLGTINWASPRVGQNGTIAPGDHGTVTITIDASGSQVGASYVIDVDDSNLPDQFNVTATTGSLSGEIAYGANMSTTVVVDIAWQAVDDVDVNDEDMEFAGTSDVEIPITVTVTQNPNPAA